MSEVVQSFTNGLRGMRLGIAPDGKLDVDLVERSNPNLDWRREDGVWVEKEEFLSAIERELNVIVIDRADLPKLEWDENGKLDTGCEWAGSFDSRYWRVTALDALAALRYHEWRTSPAQLALAEALDTANIEAHPDEIKKLIELGVRVSNDE